MNRRGKFHASISFLEVGQSPSSDESVLSFPRVAALATIEWDLALKPSRDPLSQTTLYQCQEE